MPVPVGLRTRVRPWLRTAGVALTALLAGACSPNGRASSNAPAPSLALQASATLARTPGQEAPLLTAVSADVMWLATRVAAARDNRGRGFVVVDKKNARVVVFNGEAIPLAHSAVLLGAAVGDDTAPGIGSRPIHQIRPEERTTPAGRFLGQSGRNAVGEDIVWVDYDASVSMHRVRANHAGERRLQRLGTPTPDDNRISYGCINVPAAFYDAHIKGLFARSSAMVYVLPDVRDRAQVFAKLLREQPTGAPIRN